MLNRNQYLFLQFKARRDADCLFSQLPPEIIREISTFGRDDTEFNKALNHAAYGQLDDVKKILEKNPALVLLAGNVTTPGGLQVKNTTLLEFALLSGDPEMAEMILSYFDQLKNADGSKQAGADEEKQRQLSRCKAAIDELPNQQPYDLTKLIGIIKAATPADVTAALNKDMKHPSELRDALMQFRKDVSSGTVKKPQMHYNYQTLIRALEIYDREWNSLYRASGNNYDKCDLVWRQVIGYLQRSLPAVDRFAFARGHYDLVENKKPLERKTDYKYDNGSFPAISPTDSSLTGLGFDYGIYVGVGGRRCGRGGMLLQNLCRTKTSDLQNLCSNTQNRKQSRV